MKFEINDIGEITQFDDQQIGVPLEETLDKIHKAELVTREAIKHSYYGEMDTHNARNHKLAELIKKWIEKSESEHQDDEQWNMCKILKSLIEESEK